MLPVSRSESLMRRGPPPSGSATRAPKLKSKRNPSGPSWVGSSAGGGKCGFGGGSAAAEAAAPLAEDAGDASDRGLCVGSGLWFDRNMSDELHECAALTVGAKRKVAGDVASEQRQGRRLGAVYDGKRSIGVAPCLAGAKLEAAKVELVAGGVAANRRVERGEVVERQIALAGEEDFLPARDGAGNGRRSTGNGQTAGNEAA